MALSFLQDTEIVLNLELSFVFTYIHGSKFLNRLVWANSLDPDQTAPSGTV